MSNTEENPNWREIVRRLDAILCNWEEDYSEDADEKCVRNIFQVVDEYRTVVMRYDHNILEENISEQRRILHRFRYPI